MSFFTIGWEHTGSMNHAYRCCSFSLDPRRQIQVRASDPRKCHVVIEVIDVQESHFAPAAPTCCSLWNYHDPQGHVIASCGQGTQRRMKFFDVAKIFLGIYRCFDYFKTEAKQLFFLHTEMQHLSSLHTFGTYPVSEKKSRWDIFWDIVRS